MGEPRRLAHIAALALVVVAAVRIASTLTLYSATADEATHVGAGLELFEFHQYRLQPANPPLPRLFMAALPWMAGMRIMEGGDFEDRLLSVFYGSGDYVRNVALGRVGNLFFFLLAAVALWMWARFEVGNRAALIAVLIFTVEPIVLGYSGLATHDSAATAAQAVALAVFARWLRRPDWPLAAALGAAFGFGCLSKFACIPYIPVACGAILLIRLIRSPRTWTFRAWASLLIVPVVALLVVWAGYGFTVGRFADLQPWKRYGGPVAARVLEVVPRSTILPAPQFFMGFGEILRLNQEGHLSYALGRLTTQGWWWYFPLSLLLKSTFGFLGLILTGLAVAWRSETRWPFVEAVVAALAILAIAMPSPLDLGIRYILPIFVPLSLAAALAATTFLSDRRLLLRLTGIVLLAAQVGASVFSHPDYFPYFNLSAGRDPSRYLIDSNLDWGQDVLRLRTALRQNKISTIGLSVFGNHDYDALKFPSWYQAQPWVPTKGWTAVSDHSYRALRLEGAWSWLVDRRYARVGKSIRLYYPPEGEGVSTQLRATPPIRTRVLLPFWFTGVSRGDTDWTCDLSIRNEMDRPVQLYDGQNDVVAVIPGRTTINNPPLKIKEAKRGIILSLARRDAGGVHFFLSVRSGPINVTVPVVREDHLRSTDLVFMDLPVSVSIGLTLRVYDMTGEERFVAVRLLQGEESHENTLALTREHSSSTYPSAAEVDLRALFPGIREGAARVTVVTPSAKYFAMVSVTDRVTKAVSLRLPD